MYLNTNIRIEYVNVTNELKHISAAEKRERRVPVQDEYLQDAVRLTKAMQGEIWELGFGSGRTLKILESLVPNEKILIFEKEESNILFDNTNNTLVIGDFFQTIPSRIHDGKAYVKLIHADIGTRNYQQDLSNLAKLPSIIDPFLMDGGIFVCDRPLGRKSWKLVKTAHSKGWPYYMWQK